MNYFFLINVTIHKGYIRYSDDCDNELASVYDGHIIHSKMILGEFCGHILFESLYTKLSKGLLSAHIMSYHLCIVH